RNVWKARSSIWVEVISMDGKLWTEARAIAARHDPAEREDLAQDLALSLLEQIEPPRNAGAWLERVGRNVAIDRWRVEGRRRELLRDAEPPAGAADPEAALLGRERRQLLRRAVAALPRPQRRAALARFHAGLSYDDAAQRLGTRAETARTRVHRALALLRARLASLRALFVMPGFQTAALGVAFLAAQAPATPAAQVIAGADPAPFAFGRSRPAVRVMAAAATPAPVRPVSPKPRRDPAPEPVQTLTFDPDAVDGTVSRPEGILVQSEPPLAKPSLIELRRHFVPELLKTLEDL